MVQVRPFLQSFYQQQQSSVIDRTMKLERKPQLHKVLLKYQKLGARRAFKSEKIFKREEAVYLDLTNLWTNRNNQHDIHFQAIRGSQIFSDKRQLTFLRYNYRNSEQKPLDYSSAFKQLIGHKKRMKEQTARLGKGTMNVTDLWSESNLQQVLGSPGHPLDRLKILKMCMIKAVPNASLRSTFRVTKVH